MFSDLLQAHAARDGARTALTFLGDGDAVSAALDYRALDLRAAAVAALLQARVPRGSRVLLLFPNNQHYVTAFFGCLYAGMVAVPVYPPVSSRSHHLQRLLGIVRDATPSVVLTLAPLVPVVRVALAELAAATSVAVLATDTLDGDPELFRPVTHAAEDLALLQYTSGSTSQPKGVMVSHGNLIANSAAIRAAFGIVDDDVVVSWLPLFHDMGLIGGLLQSIFSKLPLVLFSPEHFGGSPARWLRAISRYRGTVSGGPDFAYRMCVERVTASQLEGIDLSSWRVAFSGSEPIRAATLTSFADRFAPARFSARAQYGCYGLAEATLFVSGPARGAGTTIARFDARALASEQARVDDAGRALVGCGAACPDHEVAVVAPGSAADVAAGQVGEILVRGPSVTAGYWGNPEATREAWIERAGGVYLRTGDLGFMHGGELFVTGRRKDLIIVRGHNLYPQDVEQTLAEEIDVIRKGRIAVFPIDGEAGEGLGVAAELSHRTKQQITPEVLGRRMSEVVAEVHGEPLALILLLDPGTLPMTTSGKLRRSACLDSWRDQTLVPFAVIEGSVLRGGSTAALSQAGVTTSAASPAEIGAATSTASPSQAGVTTSAAALNKTGARLEALWCEVLGVSSVRPGDTFFTLGGSSLSCMQLIGRVADEFGVELAMGDVLEAASLHAMASAIDGRESRMSARARIGAVPRTAPIALSPGEQRLWFLHHVDPDSAAYTLIGSLRITGALDRGALAHAFDQLVARHEVLRTRFGQRDGRPERVIDAPWQVPVQVVDLQDRLRHRSRAAIDHEIHRVLDEQARQPFALADGRLLRVALVVLSDTEYVLIVACHHIVADGWSMDVLRRELFELYAAHRAGRPAALAALPIQVADHAAWHQSWLTSEECVRQLAYWKEILAGEPAQSVLPRSSTRDPGARRDGQHAFRIDAALTAELRALADRHDATLFMVMLGALHVVLQRYGGHDDLWVGTPIANRAAPESHGLVGFLVNTAVLRTRLDARASFAAHLARVKLVVAGALANADVPFQKIVEVISPERSLEQQALFQIMYNHLRPAYATAVTHAGLTLHEGERWGHAADFDLVLDTSEDAAGLSGVWSYRADRLAVDAIARFATEYTDVLAAVVRAPDQPIHRLPRRVEPVMRGAPGQVGPSVTESFARCAASTPSAIAVRWETGTLDYATLDARASRWAMHLRQLGVGPDVLVGLCAEPSLELVVGMLAIVKAGGAYLPLEPSDPRARLDLILCDARPPVVIVQPHLADRIAGFAGTVLSFADEAALALAASFTAAVHPDHLAYCLYTSGSSGVPKGTLLRHGGLANHLAWMRRTLSRPAADRVLQCASISFDASVCEFWLPLVSGGTCVLASRDTARDPDALIAQLGRDAITMMQAVPSLLALLLDAPAGPAALDRLRALVSGGEALSEALRDRIAALPHVAAFNLYGPTEITIDATGRQLAAADRGAVSIGGPIAGATAYVLDPWGQPVPVGGVGELHVGGAGLARGYLHRPDLTADRFVPDPFAGPGARMYRTGDLVRQRPDGAPDGALEYLDRADAQVKLHGHRIELGEIAARLTEQPEVDQAVVLVREDAPGKKQLVAYVAGAALDEAALRTGLPERLARELPAYMVPRVYVFLARLPVMASGKLDRAALPAPDVREAQASFTAPRSDGERVLAAIWAEILGVAQVGVHDNFFLLGGDSITAIQVVSRARTAGMAMSAADVFQQPTIEGLARAATTAGVAPLASEGGATLTQLDPAVRAALPVPPAEIEDVLAVTAMQEGMLLHTLLEPGSGIYLMQDRYQINRALDASAFVAAWQHVVARHSALRASFWQRGGETLQIIHKRVTGAVTYLDLRGTSAEEQAQQIDALLDDERRRGFDFGQAPLLRLRLVQLADDRYCYLESHHHILIDDWCRSLLFRDFFTAYAALRAGTPVVIDEAPQYRSFLAWLAGQDRALARAHWSATLAGIEEATPLAIDRRLLADAGPSRVADQILALSEFDSAWIAATARQLRLTVNTLAQGAWAIVLAQYAGTRDVVFGVTVAGRPPEVAGVQDMVGLFVNTIPLRVRLPEHGSATTVADWLAALQADNVANRRYEHTPLTEIQACTAVPRGEELFRSLFVFENAPLDPEVRGRAGELGIELVGNRTHTNYPVTVVILPSSAPGSPMKLVLSYDERLFAAADIARMLEQLTRVLVALATRIDEPVCALTGLSSADDERRIRQWNATERRHDWACGYAERFEQRVAQHGRQIAACHDGTEISYAALNAHANQIARALVGRGVGSGDLVGVYAERGLGLLAALIGILKAGAVYVPLDVRHPWERGLEILGASEARVVLTTARQHASLVERCPVTVISIDDVQGEADTNLELPVHPAQLAYVIYTSGSTGAPKGAMVTMAGMLNNQLSKVPYFGLGDSDVIAQTAAPSFDISVWQLLAGLLCGARIEVVSDDVAGDPVALLRHVRAAGVTVLETVPSLMLGMMSEPAIALPALRWMLPTGEALTPELARLWIARYPAIPLVNAYGPAECADDVALCRISEPPDVSEVRMPIGWPTDNTRIYVLDATLARVPIGVVGELCVAGVGVGRGYLADPARTAGVFVPDPFGPPGTRLYRTGDRARQRDDGTLEYVGRADHQVKLRGHRIELGEIEAKLAADHAVRVAVVVLREDSAGQPRLVAYAVPSEPAADPSDLRARLRERLAAVLPGYMVPSQIVLLAELPINANGKVSRRALPAPELSEVAGEYVAPRSEIERRLATIWAEVLGVPRVGIDDHFFALGGHSLLIIRVASRIKHELGHELPMRALFESPTVAALAVLIEGAAASTPTQAEIGIMADLLDELEDRS